MLDLEQYEAFEQALTAADRAGAAPLSWRLTSALYQNLDAGRDHFTTSLRAIHGAEPPIPLYGLPVAIEPGAVRSWRLVTARGEYGAGGFVEYSTLAPSHGAQADKP
jgi:hypothetical protein